jgi:hypothetical protein
VFILAIISPAAISKWIIEHPDHFVARITGARCPLVRVPEARSSNLKAVKNLRNDAVVEANPDPVQLAIAVLKVAILEDEYQDG